MCKRLVNPHYFTIINVNSILIMQFVLHHYTVPSVKMQDTGEKAAAQDRGEDSGRCKLGQKTVAGAS